MSFSDWKKYWKELDWTRKWFPFFILIRPLVDNFYFIKDISSFLSPLYIVGVLTPLLIIASMQSGKLRKRIPNSSDEFIRVWGIVIVINCVIMLITRFSIDNFGDSIKYITPVLLFFYARHFIQSKQDLHFILMTFLISCLYPFGMLAFEVFVHPLDPHHVSEGRGGGTRLRGEYGDSMSYAVYFVGSFLIYSYFYLDKVFSERKKVKVPTGKLLMLFLLCLFGVINIRHVSTWSVFLIVLVLFTYFNSKNVKGVMVVIFVGLIILPFFARQIYEAQIRPLIEKEFAVMTGEKDVEFAFNGRVQRWERYFDIWYKMPGFARFFGVSLSGFKEVPTMIGGGMHNDYIRITFLSGIFGAALYVIFIISVFFQQNRFRPPERYIILSAVAATLLYSMSTLPSLYLALMNYTFPVFAFAMLPRKSAYGVISRPATPVKAPEIHDAA
ncbi:MAG: hypothetical protein EYC69_14925 [Bacteroidetes bacterium]|nr:MAG: hypothetical protein EYC69_14925 [Bacteroidota bacterium]